jgi:Uma2 family endonuclease
MSPADARQRYRARNVVSAVLEPTVLAGDLSKHGLCFWCLPGKDAAGWCAHETAENLMGVEFQLPARAGRMSGTEFRAFQERRPDHERWELIAGIPVMMVPPTIVHNRIAGNLERLLNDALAGHDLTRLATQRLGVELASGDYKPEPDVAVIDADYEAKQRFVDRVYLVAEVVSDTDELNVPETAKRWIDAKREIYLGHASCEAVLLIEQDRMEIRVDVRTEAGWTSSTLGPSDHLILPGFGLRCAVTDLYEATPFRPRSVSSAGERA